MTTNYPIDNRDELTREQQQQRIQQRNLTTAAATEATVTKQRLADLHGVDEHSRQTEGNALRELSSVHGHLEAVSEVDVQDLWGYGNRSHRRRRDSQCAMVSPVAGCDGAMEQYKIILR